MSPSLTINTGGLRRAQVVPTLLKPYPDVKKQNTCECPLGCPCGT